MIPTLLAYAVIAIALPLNWVVTIRLWLLSESMRDNQVVRERAIVALALALIVTLFSIVFLNNEMDAPFLTVEQTQLLTRSAVLALSIPALYWLFIYRDQAP